MRKLYALLGGIIFILASFNSAHSSPVTPDVANFTFTVNAPNNTVVFVNTSTIGTEPGNRKAFWYFGDGTVLQTAPLAGTQHQYQVAGSYTVCLKIYRYYSTTNDSVLSAQICKTVLIETVCQASFTTVGVASTPLGKYFIAQPFHNQNKKPVYICWNFGDGNDTCIQYSTTYTGPYGVYHLYGQTGNYNVCVNIHYDGGCQATNCQTIQVGPADSCRADFEKLPISPSANPLTVVYKALPWHNNNKRPVRICWKFGDGTDTCIQYSNTFPGPYNVVHTYTHAGTYEVCVNILYQGGCEAQKCKPIVVVRPDSCRADFERLPISTVNNPLTVIYKALPWHNNGKKPQRICWTFGDGRDTCINYLNIYNGQYTVAHTYQHPGLYNVCVSIKYYGGCEAYKCKPIQVGRRDTCGADFERLPLTTVNNPLQAIFKALPQHNNNRKPARICWQFGDNTDTCINYSENYTGLYLVTHRFDHPGVYEVCVKIFYYGGCDARKCKPVVIARPDTCRADFERIQTSPASTSLQTYFRALPQHNNNRKPARICWQFGDNRDTCINYPENYTGQYVVAHLYAHPGLYEVCVNIKYYGGCEARKCKPIQVGRPDTCRADFEKLPVTSVNNPLVAAFKALPQHNNNRKPARICWQFGDNRDTCINYPENYNGQYIVTHRYDHPGVYEVCVNIKYYGGCEARKCKPVTIIRPDSCRADFERIQSTPNNTSLQTYFRALPWHNNNRKPATICWKFGDGNDTCIQYTQNYTGPYVVAHHYAQPGIYEVCVKIIYFGGCEARKCKPIQVGPPVTCTADFERAPVIASTPLTVGFKALPWNSANRKPSRICWTFGDGRDTCINYPETYTGQYIVQHHYQQPGQYQVCVSIQYYGGCQAYKCKPIIVQGNTATCSVSLFEITPSISSLIRGFLAIPVSVPPSPVQRICWYFGDGTDTCIMLTSTSPVTNFTIAHTYPGPGVYHACVSVRFVNGCEAVKCKEVIINGPANLCGGYMTDSLIGPRTYRFKGFSIHAPNDNVISYQWSFGDGTSASGQQVTHTYNNAGNYNVCLVIRTQRGCETRICKPLHVPGTNAPTLLLSPNPVITVLNAAFYSTHNEPVTIKILNATGTVVRTYIRNANVGPNTWSFDLSTLIPGLYSFVLQSPNQLASAIFLKQ